MDLEQIKKEVLEFSGFNLHGKTKLELKNNLKSIQTSLEDEIFQLCKIKRLEIDDLDIPEE